MVGSALPTLQVPFMIKRFVLLAVLCAAAAAHALTADEAKAIATGETDTIITALAKAVAAAGAKTAAIIQAMADNGVKVAG